MKLSDIPDNSPEDLAEIHKLLHGPKPGADDTGGGSSLVRLGERLAGSTAATVEGAAKGVANVSGELPTLVGLPALHSKWASSTNPDYPIAEGAGKLAPLGAGLAALPEVGAREAVGKIIPEFPRAAKIIGSGAEGLWKGYVGGGTQGDPKAGQEAGSLSSMARTAFRMIPGDLKYAAIPAALYAAHQMGGGKYMPWDQRHVLSYLAAALAGITGKYPGVAGAAGADVNQGKLPTQ